MTVPHLDTRYIDGERTLLFGPFANVGPKFLIHGSNLDLFKSVKPHNITTLLAAAVKNMSLLKYSFDQIIMTKEGCMNHLRTFYPEARDEDWQVYTAGTRVQVIKDDEKKVKDSSNSVQKWLTLKTTLSLLYLVNHQGLLHQFQ